MDAWRVTHLGGRLAKKVSERSTRLNHVRSMLLLRPQVDLTNAVRAQAGMKRRSKGKRNMFRGQVGLRTTTAWLIAQGHPRGLAAYHIPVEGEKFLHPFGTFPCPAGTAPFLVLHPMARSGRTLSPDTALEPLVRVRLQDDA